jgi:uncharacterized membrane protein
VIFGSLHLLIPVLNHFHFRTYAYDYAVYNFAFYDYAHFRISACPVYHSAVPVSFFQDHLSFLLMLLSPLYWVLSPLVGTYSLILVQWAFVITGAWATYRVVKHFWQREWPACAAMFMYFFLYGRFTAYHSDVNLSTMGSALIPLLLYFFYTRRKAAFWVVTVLLLVTREDFSLWLVFIAIFLFTTRRDNKSDKVTAAWLFAVSLSYFVLAFAVLIPGLLENVNHRYTNFKYEALGKDPMQALLFAVSHPVRTLSLLFINHLPETRFDYIKAEFYLLYLASGGILLLLRPVYLIPLLPLLAKKMFNDNPVRWSSGTYYSVEIVSILPVLIFLAILEMRQERWRFRLACATTALCLAATVFRLSFRPDNALLGGEEKYNFLGSRLYTPHINNKAVRRTLRAIPDAAVVSASGLLVSHVAFRERPLHFPMMDDADYVAVLRKWDSYPLTQGAFDARVNEIRENPEWLTLETWSGLIVFRRTKPEPR